MSVNPSLRGPERPRVAVSVAALCLSNARLLARQSWLADSLKRQRDSQLDFIFRVNERHYGAKPMYGREVLDFLTFLPGPCPEPAAAVSSKAEWGRSGQSSCLLAQWRDESAYWCQSHAVREAIQSIEDRLELLSDVIDR